MGNTSEIYRLNGKITIEELTITLKEISNDFFDNTLDIIPNDKGIMFINEHSMLYWWLEDEPSIDYSYNEKTDEYDIETEKSENYIEYDDVPRNGVSQWIQEVLTKEVSIRLNLQNFCPAIGELMTDPYPKSYKEYINRTYGGINQKGLRKFIMNRFTKRMYDSNLEQAKTLYPEKLYNFIVENDKNKKI